MIAAILCPGPSLAELDDIPDADVLIGVNRAVTVFPCDWWAAKDYQTIREVEPIGTPKIFTGRDTVAQSHKWGFFDKLRSGFVLIEETDFDRFKPPELMQWPLFSMTCAVMLAYSLGAGRIGLFGADMCGTLDFDGFTSERHTRTDTRWGLERSILATMKDWLSIKGVSLTHGLA